MFSKRRNGIAIGAVIAVVVFVVVVLVPTMIIDPRNENGVGGLGPDPTEPTSMPSSEPTAAAPTIAYKNLTHWGDDGDPDDVFPLDRCEGDCVSDADCQLGLECFQRDEFEPVPGCSGNGTEGRDYCYQPPIEPMSPPASNPQMNGTNEPLAKSDLNLFFLAFYYPWYHRNNWSRHGTQGSTPLLGLYGTDEVAIAEQHIDWAVNSGGIDAWVVSWWDEDTYMTDHFAEGMLSASNIDQIKFCMNYESKGALPTRDFGDGRALDKLISDMKVFRDKYFDHPSYLKINGRPVVYLHITRTWIDFRPSFLDTMKNEVGVDILFIADEPYYGRQRYLDSAAYGVRDGKPVFEAYSTYNMFEDVLVRKGESATDFMFREGLPIFDRWSRETVFFPNVLPKYHDFRGHKQLVGDTDGLMQQLETFACLPRPSWYNNDFPDMMFVTSFNEWWEGSQIEPDAQDKYGFSFLDTLKAFKESGFKCGRGTL